LFIGSPAALLVWLQELICTELAIRQSPSRTLWAAIKSWFLNEDAPCVTAVCIPPAAHLILHDSSEALRTKYGVQADEEVTFLQLSTDVNTYRDAMCFTNGRHIRLQELREGQRVTVLDLGGAKTEEGDLSESRLADSVVSSGGAT
jgi:hypothetical protein